MDLILELLREAHKVGTKFIISHLEDLGAAERGDPGSLWAWEEVSSSMAANAAIQGAAFMCHWDLEARGREPTRWASDTVQIGKLLYEGEMALYPAKRYMGPLPRECGHATHEGPRPDRIHDIRGGMWPEQLCTKL